MPQRRPSSVIASRSIPAFQPCPARADSHPHRPGTSSEAEPPRESIRSRTQAEGVGGRDPWQQRSDYPRPSRRPVRGRPGPGRGVGAGSAPWPVRDRPRRPRDPRPERATSRGRRPRRDPRAIKAEARGIRTVPGAPRRMARSRSIRAPCMVPRLGLQDPPELEQARIARHEGQGRLDVRQGGPPIAGSAADPGAHQVGVRRLGSQRDGAAGLGLGGGVIQGAQQHGAGSVDPRRCRLAPHSPGRWSGVARPPRGGRPSTRARRRGGSSGHRDG